MLLASITGIVEFVAFAEDTRIQNFSGLSGWSCWTDSPVSCNGVNKYPISVTSETIDGRSTIHVQGDPSSGTVACAKKTISSDWLIERVDFSTDLKSGKTDYNLPQIFIERQSFYPNVSHYQWGTFSTTVQTLKTNSFDVKLCFKDKSKATDQLNAYFSNIQISTSEINPEWIKEQEALQQQEQEAKRQAQIEADASERQLKAAEDIAKENERKAQADEARADAVQRSELAIERSKIAAERAMLSAERARADAEKILEYAQRELVFQNEAAEARQLAIEAMKKADEARERANDAQTELELYLQERASNDAVAAADSAKSFADQVNLIALSIPSSYAETGNFQNESDSPKIVPPSGGGCLIATATFDSELAPQVQKLREIRDSKLLSTESGSQFMEHFNSFYYSFSPIIADYERENPVFKEIVKIGITPMISTLSLMDYADTESEVLGIGISLIILNAMMYVGLPVFGIMIAKKKF
jgi:hypothetical protein